MPIKLDLMSTQELNKENNASPKDTHDAQYVYEAQEVANRFEDTISSDKPVKSQQISNNAHARKVQQVYEVYEAPKGGLEYGHTQGKKGMQLKRINITIAADNKDPLREVSARRGMSMTGYINYMLDELRSKEPADCTEGISSISNKILGSRITMGFSDANYEYLKIRSRMNGISVSRLLNQLIERELQK